MGQKIHPVGFRVGIIRDWQSKWYAERDYQRFLHEDIQIRRHLKKKLKDAGVARVTIERAANKAKVYVHAAKPGLIIGKRGSGLDALRAELQKMSETEVFLNIIEVRKVETDAVLVAENIAAQLEKRVSFRRAMKKAVTQARRSGAEGIKVICSGRLGGAEMGRTERYHEGRVPLHTLRADVDFGLAEAHTTYGVIGVRVWVFRGEVLPGDEDRAA
ncbi:MAG: 30S ribosomal protein S3 [Deltaproteobacteria bacterium]|nr:30S ribosomal protein S3 [Deltaproteobacteria bacterium]HCH63700.1 30S ribosomal protein S3 [Deltaproteobacteria bacterium]